MESRSRVTKGETPERSRLVEDGSTEVEQKEDSPGRAQVNLPDRDTFDALRKEEQIKILTELTYAMSHEEIKSLLLDVADRRPDVILHALDMLELEVGVRRG
ncbi:PREDICTED: uncharacterized protein LOC109465614 [Branchiostoma belcheri]|uniref:Uncharacterized protein LOC109465614 n=1 Tax=Branchiostoma belcheri TaxID=7741 RepID=A0A6P4YIJ0_BRABE|nr:PREDICTED: uncharacterized protein LOC109465614 [Branchiostoma belcheri]